ncbi:OmpA family protein [Tropicibacter oceani]|uniref:OmpA family protein n=1 Tax=Tropicibacter oceani TaxID=3058420 RepID=A0ABY8QLL1_9RHOB|nr:OmpA family protein [Tropicibacter oceani]WGW05535.1 OmpA family protein [Tropicibacter oceani]
MIRKTLILGALCLGLPTLAPAQQGEIFIPGAGTAEPAPPPAPRSALAACLANPDAASCAAVSLGGEGTAFESATGAPTVQFETLVLDLDDGKVHAQPEPPAKAPDYAGAAPAPTHGKVALPSVAITIEFDYDSAQVRADQIGKLASLIGALQDPALQGAAYAVIGHTDAVGSYSYNCDLSRRRAASVTSALTGGYVTLPLYPVGFGEHVLKNTYDPRAPENRRVTFMRLPAQYDHVLATTGAVCGY